MSDTQNVIETIVQQGILPLYYNADVTDSLEILRALYKAGIKAVEYTSRGDAALKNFTKMVEIRNVEMPSLLLGIGTIKKLQQAKDFIFVGADFLVSPGFVKEVAEFALSVDIFYIPGCMTPSEIITSENAGLKFIKIFPGNILGPEYLNSIKAIFPKLFFMPTGGVNLTKKNIEEWFNAGVCAVGIGSKLISKELMEQKKYETLESNTREVLALIKQLRTEINSDKKLAYKSFSIKS